MVTFTCPKVSCFVPQMQLVCHKRECGANDAPSKYGRCVECEKRLMTKFSGSLRFANLRPLPQKNPSLNEVLSHFCLTPHQTVFQAGFNLLHRL
jgi:hypothetical protein